MRRPQIVTEHEFEHEGFACCVIDYANSVCGYVRVGSGHPWHGASVDDLGFGVTYSRQEDTGWWIGFDMPSGTLLDDVVGHTQDLAGAAASASRAADRSAR